MATQQAPAQQQKTEAIEKTDKAEKKIQLQPNAPAGNQKALKAFLESPGVMAQLKSALGKSDAISAEDMTRLALVCATKQPMLLKCTMASIFRSLLDAAAMGISVGGLNGRGYLVPRNVTVKDKDLQGKEIERKESQCFLDPGYRGFMDIARGAGVGLIQAEVVYSNDEFEYWFDPLPRVRFRPHLKGERGDVFCAFAVAKLDDGSIQVEVVSKQDLDKVMNVSESGKRGSGPWRDWYAEMARKTALRRLCKFLPVKDSQVRERMNRAMIASDQADTGDPSIGLEEIDMSTGEVIDAAAVEVKGALSAKPESLETLESDLAEVIR